MGGDKDGQEWGGEQEGGIRSRGGEGDGHGDRIPSMMYGLRTGGGPNLIRILCFI